MRINPDSFGYIGAKHKCAAIGCRAQVSKSFLMCPADWGSLPAEIRDRVTKYHRPGRPLADQFAEYQVAVRHAIEYTIKAREARRSRP